MFFPDLVKGIKPGDKVLEIGPGASPHKRSDVFLEYEFDSPEMAEAQRGYEDSLKTEKPVIYYKGDIFPFGNKEFDYVICSHVIEHVKNLDKFISEIKRVGKSGYFEYPTIYYDYVYNIPEHVNLVKFRNSKIYWMRKEDTFLPEFKEIQSLFYKSLTHRYWSLFVDFKEYFIEGFEWFDDIESIQTSDLNDLLFDHIKLPTQVNTYLERKKDKFNMISIILKRAKRILRLN